MDASIWAIGEEKWVIVVVAPSVVNGKVGKSMVNIRKKEMLQYQIISWF